MKKTSFGKSTTAALIATTLLLAPQMLGTSTNTSTVQAKTTVEYAYKAKSNVVVYKSTSTKSEPVSVLKKATLVSTGKMVKKNNTTFMKVKIGKIQGYVKLTALKKVSYTFETYKAAKVTTKKYTLKEKGTVRKKAGLHPSNQTVGTLKKGTDIKVLGTQIVNKVSYTKIKASTYTGYVKSSIVKVVKESAETTDEKPILIASKPTESKTADGYEVKKTTESTQLKTFTLKSGYAYLRSTPTQHVDAEDETVESLNKTTLFTYTGKVVVDGVKYKQVVYNGKVGYVLDSVELFEIKQNELFTETSYIVDGEFYYTKKDLLVLPTSHFIPYGAPTNVSKYTVVTIVNKVHSKVTDGLLGYNVQYLQNGEVMNGFVPVSSISPYQPEYGEPDEVIENINNILKSPLKNGSLNPVENGNTVSNTSPSETDKTETDKEVGSVSSSFNTSLTDDRVRVITSTKAKVYATLPSSKNKAEDITPFSLDYYYGQVLKISSAQTTDKGTFVKVAYGNKKTGYIETKYLTNVGNKAFVRVKRNMTGDFFDMSSALTSDGKTVSFIHGSKEAYDKIGGSYANFLHVPTKITSDNVLVPANESYYYSNFYTKSANNLSDGLPDISWNDIKNLKGPADRSGFTSSPTTVEAIFEKYGQTKNYAFELENNYADVKAGTHIALAKMIKKYKLENNSIIYSYTSEDETDTDKINKEIKEISSNTKVIYVENYENAKKISKNPSSYTNKSNIDGLAVYTGYLTDDIAKTIKDKGLEVHALTYDRHNSTIGTTTTTFTRYKDYLDGYLTESIRTAYEKTYLEK